MGAANTTARVATSIVPDSESDNEIVLRLTSPDKLVQVCANLYRLGINVKATSTPDTSEPLLWVNATGNAQPTSAIYGGLLPDDVTVLPEHTSKGTRCLTLKKGSTYSGRC